MMTAADLRAWRARRRMTQAELALMIDYHPRGVQEAEKREGPISVKMEMAIKRIENAEASQ